MNTNFMNKKRALAVAGLLVLTLGTASFGTFANTNDNKVQSVEATETVLATTLEAPSSLEATPTVKAENVTSSPMTDLDQMSAAACTPAVPASEVKQ